MKVNKRYVTWLCNICHKVEVNDKGKGFRVFVKYDTIINMKGWKGVASQSTRQVRICDKCLKTDYQEIDL